MVRRRLEGGKEGREAVRKAGWKAGRWLGRLEGGQEGWKVRQTGRWFGGGYWKVVRKG